MWRVFIAEHCAVRLESFGEILQENLFSFSVVLLGLFSGYLSFDWLKVNLILQDVI